MIQDKQGEASPKEGKWEAGEGKTGAGDKHEKVEEEDGELQVLFWQL